MTYLSNAFSLQMLSSDSITLKMDVISAEKAREELSGGFVSAVGHPDTACVFSDILGLDVPMNRVSVKLAEGDKVVVGQLTGLRLPEGATKLPEGAFIRWWIITATD